MKAMTGPTCWARGILYLVEYAVGRGAARQALLSRIPLSLPSLQDPEQRVPLATYYAAIEAVADLLDDRCLGLNYTPRSSRGRSMPSVSLRSPVAHSVKRCNGSSLTIA